MRFFFYVFESRISAMFCSHSTKTFILLFLLCSYVDGEIEKYIHVLEKEERSEEEIVDDVFNSKNLNLFRLLPLYNRTSILQGQLMYERSTLRDE